MSLYAERLERGRFIWHTPIDGAVAITAAQRRYIFEGIDWRSYSADGLRLIHLGAVTELSLFRA
jgi:hypothetical protein